MDLLDRLLGHDQWATDQLLELSRNLTDEQLDQSFDIGHRTLRATFEHMIFNVPACVCRDCGTATIDRSSAVSAPSRKRPFMT